MSDKTHELRERQKERTWRLLRRTSALAAGVLLVILLALDAYFRFASSQLNLTIAGLAVVFLILSRIDVLVHRMVGIRSRQNAR